VSFSFKTGQIVVVFSTVLHLSLCGMLFLTLIWPMVQKLECLGSKLLCTSIPCKGSNSTNLILAK